MNEPTPEPQSNVTYCTVKFTAGWLPGSVAFTEQAKTALSAAVGLDRQVIRGSYAILGAGRDPLIKEGAAIKRMLSAVRDEFTIPEYTLRATAANSDQGQERPEKVKGSYLIESIKIEEFLKRFNEVRQQYLAWGQRVASPENYNRIREADKASLGSDWEVVEKRYPSANSIADSISCDIPKIEPFDASFTLADVAPETAAQLQRQAEARLEASIEGATSELILDFKDMVEAVARNCGKRIRLLPSKEGQYAHLHQAEVTQILKPEHDENIPQGKLLITVQPVKISQEKLVNNGKPQDLLLASEEYKEELRPFETDENRQLAKSSFDNLLWMAKKISTVKSMLTDDPSSQGLSELADEVERTLRDLGNTPGRITKELRDSAYARKAAKAAFQGILGRLKTEEMEIKQRKRTRRKITPLKKD